MYTHVHHADKTPIVDMSLVFSHEGGLIQGLMQSQLQASLELEPRGGLVKA